MDHSSPTAANVGQPQQPPPPAGYPYYPPAYPAYPAYAYPAPAARPGNGIAVAGMVLGICGLGLAWIPGVGALCGLLGAIFGSVGLARYHRDKQASLSISVTGLVTGVIGVLLFVVILAVV